MRAAKHYEQSIPLWGFSNLNQTRPHIEEGVALRKLEQVTSLGPFQPICFLWIWFHFAKGSISMEEKEVAELRIWETGMYVYDQMTKTGFQLFTFSGLVFLWKTKLEIVWKREIQLNQKSLIFLAPVCQK